MSSVCARLLLLGPLLLVAATSDFPTQSRVGDRVLALNGEGVRTYSWLSIEIYRAALYLEARDNDAKRILASPELKEIRIRYLQSGDRSIAERAWDRAFQANCACAMPAAFRARIANIAAGDEERYLFFPDRVLISLNGREPVAIPGISQTVLATFIGAHPPTEVLKRALLGGN